MAIILLISIAKGVQIELQRQVESLGANLLIVVPFRFTGDGPTFNPNVAGLSYLKEADVDTIRRIEGVRDAVPFVFPGGSIRQGKREITSALIIATEPRWFRMRPFPFAEGGPLAAAGSDSRTVVLGQIAKDALFGAKSRALGQTVVINEEVYRVVGVTRREEENSLFSSAGLGNVVFIPYGYIKEQLQGPPLSRIFVQTEPDVDPKKVIARIEEALGRRLNKDNFSVITQRDLLKLLFSIMQIVTALLFGLTSIALVVGGLGIMTVMLMSVGERAKEIGIRKTVGATRQDIFLQFLSEALTLAMIGGIVGLAASYGICTALRTMTVIKPVITWQTIALAMGVSAGIGGVFGLIPAMKAARQDPVASLRHE